MNYKEERDALVAAIVALTPKTRHHADSMLIHAMVEAAWDRGYVLYVCGDPYDPITELVDNFSEVSYLMSDLTEVCGDLPFSNLEVGMAQARIEQMHPFNDREWLRKAVRYNGNRPYPSMDMEDYAIKLSVFTMCRNVISCVLEEMQNEP